LLKDKHGDAGEPQLAGQEKADWASSGDYDVVDDGSKCGHRKLLGRWGSTGAFLDLETARTNGRTLDGVRVRRGDLRREAKDQSFRYRKGLG
jgi:hypothetical protein